MFKIGKTDIPEMVIRFFSFFTILTNNPIFHGTFLNSKQFPLNALYLMEQVQR
jgi:hypothetical protein